MNWDNEIELNSDGGKVLVTLGETHSLLTWELSKDDIEEFAAELIKWAEFSPTPILLGD
jgi:hypothetical protein